MRKSIKKILAFASAACIAGGALSLAACGTKFTPPQGIPEGDAVSNGGFVVLVEDYYYFINGVETYSSDNTYGKPVKGALMRAKKEGGVFGEAETVVPSLMVAGSFGGGLYIYGDKVYYATPTNVKGIDGEVQNNYLDFASANLDGRNRKELVRVSSNATDYRFIEENGTVYLVYYDSTATTLHSYNTATEKDTVLAEGLASAPVFHKTDKENTAIYYTMTVTDRLDSDHPKEYAQFYNQIYRVTAGTTEAPYPYEWDEDWLKENNDGEEPYTNLGTLVLDGIGQKQDNQYIETTQFNHGDRSKALPRLGYTYTLRSYDNGGIYFTRRETEMDTVGAGDALYYLPEAETVAEDWDSIGGNAAAQCVANAFRTADEASESALYYIDNEGDHHYLYVDGDGIFRADPDEKGEITGNTTQIAYNASGATLISLDPVEGDDEYGYVYYTLSVNGNLSVNRAVYDNKAHKIEQRYYTNLEDATFPYKDAYAATRLLDIVHATGWYNFEIIGNELFFADADASAYGSSLNYVSCVSLANAAGKLMDNAELKAFNAMYNEITGYDTNSKVDGLLSDISEEQEEDILSNAVKYYFYTGERTLLDENAKEYADAEADEDNNAENPYTEDILKAFDSYVNGEELTYNGNTYTLKDGEKSYRTRSYFVTKLGKMNEKDAQSYEDYWKSSVLSKYTAPATEEKEGLASWKIALIVVACVLAVAAAVIAAVVVLKKKKKENAPKTPRMHVDTTDDKDIDVYADEETPRPEDELVETYEAPAEEAPEEPEGEQAPAEPEDPYQE